MRIRGFEFVSEEKFIEDWKDTFGDSETIERIRYIYYNLKLPKRATMKSAGYDIFSPIGFILEPNQEIKIPTGIKSYMLDDEVLDIHSRSGHGFKYIRLANCTGIIDCDYYNSSKIRVIYLLNLGTKERNHLK